MATKKKKESKKADNTENVVEESQDTKNTNEETEVTKELTPEEKYSELNNRFLRLYAEFENYRKRTNKERLDLITNANSDLLKDLVPVIDDFERAMQNMESSDNAEAIQTGINLIYNKFKNILENKGLKHFKSIENDFDPEVHEAITKIPAPSNKLKGKVVDEIEKGYMLNDKVIRFAKVVVGE